VKTRGKKEEESNSSQMGGGQHYIVGGESLWRLRENPGRNVGVLPLLNTKGDGTISHFRKNLKKSHLGKAARREKELRRLGCTIQEKEMQTGKGDLDWAEDHGARKGEYSKKKLAKAGQNLEIGRR